jgi:hypothetical protein
MSVGGIKKKWIEKRSLVCKACEKYSVLGVAGEGCPVKERMWMRTPREGES